MLVSLTNIFPKRLYVRPVLVARKSKAEHHNAECQEVWNQRDDSKELCQLSRRPGSLEISSSMEQRHSRDTERKHIALNKRRGYKRPGIDDGQLRDQRQVGNDDVGVGSPLAIPDRSAEDGLAEKRNEEDTCNRRNIYSRRHRDVV
jgi:hypothetical protein